MTRVENDLWIEAPIKAVWDTLVDHRAYPEWNPRLIRIEGILAKGAVIALTYHQGKGWLPKRFVVDVDVFDVEKELRWSGPKNSARRALRASHYFKVESHGERTRLTHGEHFEGILAKRIWRFLGPLVAENHRDLNEAIKRRCEEMPRTG